MERKETEKKKIECFIEILRNLKESSKEAVETLDKLSEFKQYLHIERPIEKELYNLITNVNLIKSKQLILVCGGVGDGKSHLISYLKNKFPSLFINFELHNDATESLTPTKTAMETLNEKLNHFSDNNLYNHSEKKLIIAINLGTLNNFINSDFGKDFSELKKYIEDKKIFETKVVNNDFDKTSIFHFVNFTDYHLYSLTENGAKSQYIEKIFTKIFDESKKNYFYESYTVNCLKCEVKDLCPIKFNYEYLKNENNRKYIVDKIIELAIKYKTIISTRELLNFIYEIIVGSELDTISLSKIKNKIKQLKIVDKINLLTNTILFENKGGKIFEKMIFLDPLNKRKEFIDNLLIQLNTTKNISEIINNTDFNLSEYIKNIILNSEYSELEKNKKEIIKYILRNHKSIREYNDNMYNNYVNNLYLINRNDNVIQIYKDIRTAITNWNGKNSNNNTINILIGQKQLKYKISQKIEILLKIPQKKENKDEKEIHKFISKIVLYYSIKEKEKSDFIVELDFFLYELLMKVKDGYNLNKNDIKNYIKFNNIIKDISLNGHKNEELIIEDLVNNLKFAIKKDEIDDDFFEYKELN